MMIPDDDFEFEISVRPLIWSAHRQQYVYPEEMEPEDFEPEELLDEKGFPLDNDEPEPEDDGVIPSNNFEDIRNGLIKLVARLNNPTYKIQNPWSFTRGDLFSLATRSGGPTPALYRALSHESSHVNKTSNSLEVLIRWAPKKFEIIYWTQEDGWEYDRDVNEVKQSVRNQLGPNLIKEMYGSTCQCCDVLLTSPNGPVAEAAHIWEVANGGPDTIDNLLCLCPNCHSRFDANGWILRLASDEVLQCDMDGSSKFINMLPEHNINPHFINQRNMRINPEN